MEKVLVDTNILLDWLARRDPFYESAELLFASAEQNKVKVLISTMTFISTEYLIRKEIGNKKSRQTLSAVRSICTVCTSGKKETDLAIASRFKDFEDAFQYYTAIGNGADAIITRNLKDFSSSKIPVFTAKTYVKSRKL